MEKTQRREFGIPFTDQPTVDLIELIKEHTRSEVAFKEYGKTYMVVWFRPKQPPEYA